MSRIANLNALRLLCWAKAPLCQREENPEEIRILCYDHTKNENSNTNTGIAVGPICQAQIIRTLFRYNHDQSCSYLESPFPEYYRLCW